MCTPQWSKTNTYCAPPALQPVNKQNQVVHLYKCKNYLWLRICKYVKFQSLAVNLWFINVSHLFRNERNELIKTFFFAFVLTPAVSLRQAAGGTNCPVQFSFSDMRKVTVSLLLHMDLMLWLIFIPCMNWKCVLINVHLNTNSLFIAAVLTCQGRKSFIAYWDIK